MLWFDCKVGVIDGIELVIDLDGWLLVFIFILGEGSIEFLCGSEGSACEGAGVVERGVVLAGGGCSCFLPFCFSL